VNNLVKAMKKFRYNTSPSLFNYLHFISPVSYRCSTFDYTFDPDKQEKKKQQKKQKQTKNKQKNNKKTYENVMA